MNIRWLLFCVFLCTARCVELSNIKFEVSIQPRLAIGERSECSFFFGSDHKTGTVLAGQLQYRLSQLCANPIHTEWFLSQQWNHLDSRVMLDEVWRHYDQYKRYPQIIYLVRSPINMVISGYCYHLESDEAWLSQQFRVEDNCKLSLDMCFSQNFITKYKSRLEQHGTYQQLLKSLTREDGIRMEYDLAIRNLDRMVDTYAAVEAYEQGHIFTLEDFTYTFEVALHRLLNVLNVRSDARKEVFENMRHLDVSWMKLSQDGLPHVTSDRCDKAGFADALVQYDADGLERYSRALGYEWIPGGISNSQKQKPAVWQDTETLYRFGLQGAPHYLLYGFSGPGGHPASLMLQKLLLNHPTVMSARTESTTTSRLFSESLGVVSGKDEQTTMLWQYLERFSEAHQAGKMVGDVSAYEACWHVPFRTVGLFPMVKPVFVLTNPTRRAMEEYSLCSAHATDQLDHSFAGMVRSQLRRINSCDEKMSDYPVAYRMETCYLDTPQLCFMNQEADRVNYNTLLCRHNVQLGMYSVFLRHWLEHFPNILVVLREDLERDSQPVLKELYRYLKLDDYEFMATSHGNTKPVDDSLFTDDDRFMKDQLSDFYRPWNDELDILLGLTTNY